MELAARGGVGGEPTKYEGRRDADHDDNKTRSLAFQRVSGVTCTVRSRVRDGGTIRCPLRCPTAPGCGAGCGAAPQRPAAALPTALRLPPHPSLPTAARGRPAHWPARAAGPGRRLGRAAPLPLQARVAPRSARQAGGARGAAPHRCTHRHGGGVSRQRRPGRAAARPRRQGRRRHCHPQHRPGHARPDPQPPQLRLGAPDGHACGPVF